MSTTRRSGRGRKREPPEPTVPCRVCMVGKPQDQLVQLFDRKVQDGETLAHVLSLVGAVAEPQEADKISKLCCRRCVRELETAYQLRALCQESDRKLRELYAGEDELVIKVELDGEAVYPVDVACKTEVFTLDGPAHVENSELDLAYPEIELTVEEPSQPNIAPTPETKAPDSETDNGNLDDDSDSDYQEEVPNAPLDEKEDSSDTKDSVSSAKKAKPEFPDVFDEVPAISFICCGCRKRFPTQEELQAHSQAEHASNQLSASKLKSRKQCEICYKIMRDLHAFELHRQIGKLNYRCKTCGEVFISRTRVCTHSRKFHGPNPVVSGSIQACCGCGQSFDSPETLMNHSATVHQPSKPNPDEKRPFVCEICFHNFPTKLRLYAHQIRFLKGKSKAHQCVHCGKTFASPGVLRDHETSHTGLKMFQCTECPRTYTNKDAFRKHKYQHLQPEDRYKCSICNKCFKRKPTLNEHMLVHSGERPFGCPYCPAKFARRGCRLSHIRTHTGKKDFPCPQCDKRFPCTTDRNRHLNYFHNKARPFPCFFCPNRYPRKDYRRKHMESAHAAEMLANPVPAIELSGGNRWTNEAAAERG
ncbi:gastrula zinc finger protein XlCGF26.1-like [Culex pipiens pallens]|uniref:gastrula zinc finger protein XlCGF26.1-like n=1 Tax=Culex pipiens pallens TaxID=42434 RepID=UPI0019531A8C|nr:gastrula zinc finger protein XlCGF26.1-like [Culex pipiens pallens]